MALLFDHAQEHQILMSCFFVFQVLAIIALEVLGAIPLLSSRRSPNAFLWTADFKDEGGF